MIAKIAVAAANFAIDKPYSYMIPREITLQPGMRVQVPFGRSNRRTEGVVLSVEAGEETGLKPVELSLDDMPVLSNTMLRLAAFMRERYFCTFYDAVRTMLPAGIWFQTKETYTLTQDLSWQKKNLRDPYAKVLLQTVLSDVKDELTVQENEPKSQTPPIQSDEKKQKPVIKKTHNAKFKGRSVKDAIKEINNSFQSEDTEE